MSVASENVMFGQSQVVYDIQTSNTVQDSGFVCGPDFVEGLPPSLEESQVSFKSSSHLVENPCVAIACDNLSSVRRTTQRVTCETRVWPVSTALAPEISYYSCCGSVSLNVDPTNIPVLFVDPKCNSVLCSNNTVENESDSSLYINNSSNSNIYYHNSPTSTYSTISCFSPQYDSSDNGYASCTESFSSLSPFPYNQFEWIDNLILEARKEIEIEQSNIITKSSKHRNFVLMTNLKKNKSSKKHCLLGMSYSDIAKRKKEQNRIAAQRYRVKQKATQKAENEEMEYLENRNTFLRAESERLEKEIEEIKSMMLIYMN